MFYKDKFCTAKMAKSANYAGSVFVCVCFFFRKVDENYASLNLSKTTGKCRWCHEAEFLN